jgi:hypothetical protein
VEPTFVKTRRAPPAGVITTQVGPKFVKTTGQTGASLGDHTQTLEVTAERLTATKEEFKADYVQNSHGNKKLARYDYNPLVRTPFINFGTGLAYAPAPRLIMRTVTPGGLYYPGISKYGNAFADDMGKLFEYYIGRNLALIDGAEVHPEIAYGSKKSRKSVD